MSATRNLTQRIAELAQERPEAPAVVLAASTVTFRRLERLVRAAGARLSESGVRAGDVVALAFASEFALLVAMLATARLGATVFSIPRRTPPIQRAEMAARAKASRLVTDVAGEGLLGLPSLSLDPKTLAAPPTPSDPSVADASPQAPWLLVSGSGSTGRPKYYAVSHEACIARVGLWNQVIPLGEGDRVAALSPLDFTGTKQRYLEALLSGAAVVVDRAQPDPVALCRRHGVTVLSAAVVHVENLLRGLPAGTHDALGGLRALRLGASTVSDSLRRRVVNTLTRNVYVSYSTNETGVLAIARPAEALGVSGTVGRPIDGVSLRIVEAGGRELPRGRVGLVSVKTPGAIERYVDDPAADRQAFRDGWFQPGDLGLLTEDGQLIHYGRADHMMIADGINVYPAEIEATLTAHPAVADAAAVPVRHLVHQDVPVCAVALHPSAHAQDSELMDYAIQRLGARGPRRVVVLERIPRNEQGKLVRAELARVLADALGLTVGERPAAPSSAPDQRAARLPGT
jgi:acyl-coenzyme A synthetase/AMP-(fatty) acid ligase